jgi:glycosyltransferase involved in cell wall biosynthesis
MALKVSLIIPIFNSENYLNKCLDSIIYQTYSNLEIILINDGSTDSSPSIIDKYASKDNRIKAIHKENGGIGSAYKVAFKIMTGDYVLFVDSDDWLELNAVEELVKLAVNNYADIVYFGILAFDKSGSIVEVPVLKSIDKVCFSNYEIIKTHFEIIKHPTLVRLFKRNLFNSVEVFEQNIGIDEMLLPQLLIHCQSAVYSTKTFYNLFLRPNSVSRMSYSNRTIMDTLKIYNFLMNYAERNITEYVNVIASKYRGVLIGFYFTLINQNQNRETKGLIRNCRTDFILVNRMRKTSHYGAIDFLISMIITFIPPKISSRFYRVKKFKNYINV